MKNLKENIGEYIWNIITYIICGIMVLAGVLAGVGTVVVAYPALGIFVSVIICGGFISGSIIFAFTVLSFSKALYNGLYYSRIYKDYARRKFK